MEKLDYYEQRKRVYLNGVSIEYEAISKTEIYIHSIQSRLKMQGRGTESLKHFIQEFKHCDIYLFSSSEQGTDVEVLNKWYKKLGFKVCRKRLFIPFHATHCKYARAKKTKEV